MPTPTTPNSDNKSPIEIFKEGAGFVIEQIDKRSEKLLSDVEVIVKKYSTFFWSNVGIGVASSFAFAIILILSSYIFNKTGNPFAPIMGNDKRQIEKRINDSLENLYRLKRLQEFKMDSIKKSAIDSVNKRNASLKNISKKTKHSRKQ
jgi:hypothetical protein